ncbi:MAG: NUDIX hydrolase [Desulfococcaceae bacterium]
MGNSCHVTPQVAVGAVVFRHRKCLLVLRKNPPSAGYWAIPGGRVNPGESLRQAAEREIREETGVVIRAGDPVYVFDSIERDEQGNILSHYVVIDLKASYVSGEPDAGDDALDARWFSAEEMGDKQIHPLTRKLLKKQFDFGI